MSMKPPSPEEMQQMFDNFKQVAEKLKDFTEDELESALIISLNVLARMRGKKVLEFWDEVRLGLEDADRILQASRERAENAEFN